VHDVPRNYLAIDHYERLVLARGWPSGRDARWLGAAVTGARAVTGIGPFAKLGRNAPMGKANLKLG
jgi:hypothetical protein